MNLQMRPPESDHTLLDAFAKRQCQRSFARLVERHGAMVYSAALRQVRRRDLADDVTQAVFLLLAQRAGSISSNIVLAAWLHKTCRYVCLNALKMERRRTKHEQQAATMAREENKAAGWSSLWPVLDESIEKLSDADRTAIVLRFLEQRSLAEVGRELGVSEDAAGMRVSRALERLRVFFHRRGIGLSTANLGIVLGLQLPHAMPPEIAAIASRASASTLTAPGPTVSPRAMELARDMNRAIAWEATRSAALALVTAAAVFALLCSVATWWVTPADRSADRMPVAIAEASPPSTPLWTGASRFALP